MSEATASSWQCPLCHFFASKNLKGVVRHIGAVHSHEASFHITCGIVGCPRTYGNFHSYKKHMFQKHREIMEVSTTSITTSETVQESGDELYASHTSEPTSFILVSLLDQETIVLD